jgi:hypothetical protein
MALLVQPFGPAAAGMYLPPSPPPCRSTPPPSACLRRCLLIFGWKAWPTAFTCAWPAIFMCAHRLVGRHGSLGTLCWPYATSRANHWDRIGACVSVVLRVDAIFFSIFYEQHNKPKKLNIGPTITFR